MPFVVKCDASDEAISATLNQGGPPVAFMSRTLQGSEIYYPAYEKKAPAVIEAVKKWSHLLSRQTFTLITDQRSVAFMFDSRRRAKIKTDKVQLWRTELASYSNIIQYRPGQRNVGPDTFTRAYCFAVTMTCSGKIYMIFCVTLVQLAGYISFVVRIYRFLRLTLNVLFLLVKLCSN